MKINYELNLPPNLGKIIMPNADPHKTRASKNGTTFNR